MVKNQKTIPRRMPRAVSGGRRGQLPFPRSDPAKAAVGRASAELTLNGRVHESTRVRGSESEWNRHSTRDFLHGVGCPCIMLALRPTEEVRGEEPHCEPHSDGSATEDSLQLVAPGSDVPMTFPPYRR